MVLSLLLLSCGGHLSNQIFYEDQEFLDALPTRENFTVEYTEDFLDSTFEFDGTANLFQITVSQVLYADWYLSEVTAITDTVRTLDPALRQSDYRLWGPWRWEARYPDTDTYLRVEMTRAEAGASFTYAFSVSDGASGPWENFFSGTHYAGETIALGDGSLTWYAWENTSSTGTLDLSYDLRDGLEIAVDVDNVTFDETSPQTFDTTLRHDEGIGDMEFFALWNIDDAGRTECLKQRSLWDETGAGRSDASVYGGDLEDTVFDLHQCWDAEGVLTAQWDSLGWEEEIGNPEVDCVIDAKDGFERLIETPDCPEE